MEAWRPKGLAHALNVLTRTYEAVRVDQVVGDGPADHAVPRLEKGDQLKAIDGEPVTGLEHAKKMIIGMSGTKITMKFVRNQYSFEVTMVRGLRGGPSSLLEADSDAEDESKSETAPKVEEPKKKLANGLPTFYSRGDAKPKVEEKEAENDAIDAKSEGAVGKKVRKAKQSKSAAADALDERLKALGVNSFSGEAEDDEDGDGDGEATGAGMAPFARFKDATAPKMRGVISSGSGDKVALGQELLDKALLGDVAAIRLLVASGADVNFVDEEPGWGRTTPLLNAATAGSKPAVLALLLLGARVSASDQHGWTALHRAAGKGHKATVSALLQAGSDPTVQDKSGLTAADWARFCGFLEVAAVLAQGAINGQPAVEEPEKQPGVNGTEEAPTQVAAKEDGEAAKEEGERARELVQAAWAQTHGAVQSVVEPALVNAAEETAEEEEAEGKEAMLEEGDAAEGEAPATQPGAQV